VTEPIDPAGAQSAPGVPPPHESRPVYEARSTYPSPYEPSSGYQPSFGYQPPSGYDPFAPVEPPPLYSPPPLTAPGPVQPLGPDPAVGHWVYIRDSPPAAPEPDAPWWKPRGRRLAAVVTAVVGVVAIVIVAVIGGHAAKPPTLVAPQSFGGYSQVTSDTADRISSELKSLGASEGPDTAAAFRGATVATYGDNGDTVSLIFFGFSAKGTDAFGGSSPTEVTSEVLSALATNPTTYPAGPHGGSLTCAQATVGIASETVCAWDDSKVFGMVVSANPALDPSVVAGLVNQLRDELH
jgi:hypothetical protein